MFAQVLYTQWKWQRTELFAMVLAAFLIPTIILRVGYDFVDGYAISNVLSVVALAGVFFASLAMVSAFALAWRPYVIDQALRHVGPLTLPIPWPAFVRLRFAAGATLLLIPTLAVWIGCIVATTVSAIPPTLHAYPGGIALRFLLATLVAYSLGFLLQYVAGKHAVRVALFILFGLLAIGLGTAMLGYESVLDKVWDALTTWPGPFSIFNARWMLIDV
jgi:hypothetical protein